MVNYSNNSRRTCNVIYCRFSVRVYVGLPFFICNCIVQKGDAATAKDDVELPSGWEWKEDWQVDLNRAVDEYGKAKIPFALTRHDTLSS